MRGPTIRLVDAASLRSVRDGLELKAPDRGCILGQPQFQANGRLLVPEECGGKARALLTYDPATGRLASRVASLPGGMVIDLSIDASGQHVLVLVDPLRNGMPPTAYTVRGGRLVKVFSGDIYMAAW